MVLERVPSGIRKQGAVARMSDPKMIKGIKQAVSIPVMAKARIGHIAEAQILEALEVDYIDESEVLTPADAALIMLLGCDGVFVGSGIFRSENTEKRAQAIVKAVTHYNNPAMLAEISEDLGEAMSGIEISRIQEDNLYSKRGW